MKNGRKSPNEGFFKYTEQQVYDALVASGTKGGAADILGCARKTINNYMKRYVGIKDAVVEAKASLVDLAEGELMKLVKNGHPPSIFFVLKTLGKDRGYVERSENTGKNGGPIEFAEKIGNDKARDAINKLINEAQNVTSIDQHQKRNKPQRPVASVAV